MNRKAMILRKLAEIIGEMSGLDAGAIDPQASFLDLGFDSLFLTQANLRFRREFKVKITFRQLFDEAPTLDALAAYVDGELPADAMQEELAAGAGMSGGDGAPPAPGASPVENPAARVPALPTIAMADLKGLDLSVMAPPQTSPAFDGELGALMQILVLQNQTNAAILQTLAGGTLGAPSVAPGAGTPAGPPASQPGTVGASTSAGSNGASAEGRTGDAASASSSPAASTDPVSTAPRRARREASAPKAFGPYKPVTIEALGGLDVRAQEALDQFCREYAARTRRSKELAETQRPVLSDARSISGFRRDWKEIVYQIAQGSGSKGPRVWDLDGNEYIDMTSSFGISLFGHSPEWAVEAAKRQIDSGFELGTLSPLAKEAAELIRDLTGMDRSTFTNTGSEALAAAVRAARTTTAKDRIAVFYDEYHGIGDELLVNCLDLPGGRKTIPTSPGIPDFIVENVLVLKWDDEDFLGTIREHADELAAVIIEPVQNRNPSLKTSEHFQAIREVTREHNIAMIFDEMITGFRLAPGGAQEYFGVEVDISCYGKIMSGGMPCAAVSGRGSFLDCFDGGPWRFGDDSFPEAGVTFFGGTFTRHPVAVATAHAALKAIKEAGPEAYEELNRKSRRFAHRLNEILVGSGYPARIEHRESIFNLKWDDANPYSRLILWQLRHRGVLVYDRPFFMTTSHTEEDLEFVLQAFRDSVAFLQDSGIVPVRALDGHVGGPRDVAFNQSQMEVWLATRLSPEASRAFHEQVIYDLEGPVDVDALRHALQRVVHRHEGLRATEHPAGERWIVHPAGRIPVEEVDLTSHTEAEARTAMARDIREDLAADFDLVSGPLMRCTLYRTAPERSTLVLTAHHLVIDGWSMGVVLNDLSRYYAAALRMDRFGEASPDSLTSFLADEKEYLASDEYRETEAFWVGQYAGALPEPLHLPLDRPRPEARSYRGERQGIRFDPELVAELERFCAQHKVTSFTALYAAFTAFMAGLTGQDDVVVGVPMAGQAVAGRPHLVGHAVNFLPFRTRIDGEAGFRELLSRTRDYILDLNDHQRFTYASLLRKLPVRRSAGADPLVSVTFNVDQGMESFDFGGVEARYITGPRDYVKYDLFVNVVMESDGPILEVDHNTDILEAATVRRWVEDYFDLLRAVMADPDRGIASLAGRGALVPSGD